MLEVIIYFFTICVVSNSSFASMPASGLPVIFRVISPQAPAEDNPTLANLLKYLEFAEFLTSETESPVSS